MGRQAVVILAFAVAGCSTSGVFETSPGVYSVSATAITTAGGAATAKGKALRQATDACAAQGKALEVITQQSESTFSNGTADLTFRCVAK